MEVQVPVASGGCDAAPHDAREVPPAGTNGVASIAGVASATMAVDAANGGMVSSTDGLAAAAADGNTVSSNGNAPLAAGAADGNAAIAAGTAGGEPTAPWLVGMGGSPLSLSSVAIECSPPRARKNALGKARIENCRLREQMDSAKKKLKFKSIPEDDSIEFSGSSLSSSPRSDRDWAVQEFERDWGPSAWEAWNSWRQWHKVDDEKKWSCHSGLWHSGEEQDDADWSWHGSNWHSGEQKVQQDGWSGGSWGKGEQ